MSHKKQQIYEQIIPFIILGIATAVVIGLFIMLSYALIWGVILGGIFWLASLVKNYLFPSAVKATKAGRIIEHDDKYR
jgi:hypothetical protein